MILHTSIPGHLIVDATTGVADGIAWHRLTCRRAAVVQRSHQCPTAPALGALQDLHITQNMPYTCNIRPAACAWHCMVHAFLDTGISTEVSVWLLHACTCESAYFCWRNVRASLHKF